MCPLLAPVLIGFFFLLQPLTVLMKQTRQAVGAIKQSILLRCPWLSLKYYASVLSVIDIYGYVHRLEQATFIGQYKDGKPSGKAWIGLVLILQNFFRLYFLNFCNKLECLTLAGISSLF
jgi:hypothetical protein